MAYTHVDKPLRVGAVELKNRIFRLAYDVLSECNSDVRVVGDANSPRFLETAIREGHIAGATI